MKGLFDPDAYYLVLFDFAALQPPTVENGEPSEIVTTGAPDINARIWQVNPQHPGFALCMVDYYVNIRANSTSKAPFNFWPYSLKFQLMRPLLVYHAMIGADDVIRTLLFRGAVGTPEPYPIMPFPRMLGSRANLGDAKLRLFAQENGITIPAAARRGDMLVTLEAARTADRWNDDWLATQLAELLYRDAIRGNEGWLPQPLRRVDR